MKLLEKRFDEYDHSTGFWIWNKGVICAEELARRFDIPESVESIWIALHTRPGADRWPVSIRPRERPGTYLVDVDAHEGIGAHRVDDPDFDRILKRHYRVAGRKLYVEVQYEE